MAAKTLQRSLAAGELSPDCYGRLDLRAHSTGLAIARNFFTTPHGSALNRAGFKYVLETKDSTKRSVLLPFSFNTEQTYVLEFGDEYIRVHLNGGTLLEASQNITAVSQADPGVLTYTGADPANGDWVYVAGVGGMTELNGRYFKVANVDTGANTFELTSIHGGANIDTSAYGAYTAGGTMSPVLEVTSPYDEADLYELHIAQSADVLTITHPSYAPRELSRVSATSWTLTEVEFLDGPTLEINEDFSNAMYFSSPTEVLPGGYTFRLKSTADIFRAEDVGRLVRVDKADHEKFARPWEPGKAVALSDYRFYNNNYYFAFSAGTSGTVPPTHTSGVQNDGDAGILWKYQDSGQVVVKVVEYVSAQEVKVFFSFDPRKAGVPVSTSDGPTGPIGGPTTASGDGVTLTFAIAATSDFVWDYVVYVDGVLQIPYTQYNVDNAANTITFTTPPPVGVNNITVQQYTYVFWSYNWYLGAWGDEPGFPAAVSYFGGRLAYAGSEEEPQNIWLSRAGVYKNFGTTQILADDEAIDIALADRQVNRVRDLVALKHLVALTSSRAWHLVGDADNVLTPTATAEPGDAVGISTVQAEVVGGHALYVDAVGNAIHKLYYGALPTGESGYLSEDLSVLAEHLTRNKTIIDIAFQRKPYPILWCVRSDGYLLGLTYNPRHEVVAWHQHLTDGEFESVAVVTEGTEDVLYAVIKRTINGRTVRYVERQASRRFVTLADCFFVDAGLSYEGAAQDTITGLWHLEGETVVGLMDGAVFTKTVEDGQITLDVEASKVHVGLAYTADLQTLPLVVEMQAAGQGTTKNVGTVSVRLADSSTVKAGPSFDQLDEMVQREDEAYGSAPNVVTGLRRVPIQGTWTEDGQVCVRQENPLPTHITQLVLEVAVGG